jgi:protein ImuA
VEDRLERTLCLERLRRRIARLETGAKRHGSGPPVPSGCEALDGLLPEKGFCRGTLVEWLSAGQGVGACTLALLAAKQACGDGGMLAVFDRRREFCPPAAVRLGIAPQQLLVIHADTPADNHWAIDQALRSPAVAAALAWPDRLDDRTFRRWQLAAEEGGCLGLLLRPEKARHEPSWADVRLLVEPYLVGPDDVPLLRRSSAGCNLSHGTACKQAVAHGSEKCQRLLRIVLLRCRGGNAGRGFEVELDDETYRVHSLDRRRRQIAN